MPAIHARIASRSAAESAPSGGMSSEPPVAVIGHTLWKTRFDSDPQVLGRAVKVGTADATIVGVMPPRFMFRGADVYLPIQYRAGETPEGVSSVHVTARRKAAMPKTWMDIHTLRARNERLSCRPRSPKFGCSTQILFEYADTP